MVVYSQQYVVNPHPDSNFTQLGAQERKEKSPGIGSQGFLVPVTVPIYPMIHPMIYPTFTRKNVVPSPCRF
jgi:hypothetical protein